MPTKRIATAHAALLSITLALLISSNGSFAFVSRPSLGVVQRIIEIQGERSDLTPLDLFASNFLGDLPNPFAKVAESLQPQDSAPPPVTQEPLDPNSPEALFGKAKTVLASDLGVQDATLLDETFRWIGPAQEQPLGKTDYLAAGKFFDLRSTFPDLNYRAHDFRIDERDPQTVRVTVRTVGTMRGALRLRKETIQPNGMEMRCPPEAISMTFDKQTGKLVKLCSGFAMDRLVGNTDGLCGVKAAAAIAGAPPSDWELYPIPTVLSRFFGRPAPQLDEASSFLAPFPETVMIQLTKGIVAACLGADDPTLLSDKSFFYYTPTKGPINKRDFLESYARDEFGNSEPECSHFRVDPYDPYRVWVDVKPVGPGFEGPPQAVSFTFDDDGFCTRISAGAVMDPSIGNTGGLTGIEGIKYAKGEGAPGVATRPFPVALERLKKGLLSPITKVGVDQFDLPSTASPSIPTPKTASSVKAAVPKPPKPPTPPSTSTLSDAMSKLEMPAAPLTPLARQQQGAPVSSGSTASQDNQRQADAKRKQQQMQAQKEESERKRQAVEAQQMRREEDAKKQVEERRAAQRKAETEKRKRQAAAIKNAAKAKQEAQQTERKPNPTLSLFENLVPPSPAPSATSAEKPNPKQQVERKPNPTLSLFENLVPSASSPNGAAPDTDKASTVADRKEKREEAARAAAQKKKEMAEAAAEARRKQEQARREAAEKKKQEAQRKADEAKAQREEAEQKKAAAEEQRKAAAQAKVQAAKSQAERQKAEAEAKKQKLEDQKAEVERKRQEAAAKRQAAQEARQKAAEEKKAEAERKRQEAIAKREAEQDARRKAAEEKKAEAERKRQGAAAKTATAKSKPATPSPAPAVFGFGLPKPKQTTAPPGVPTIVSWRVRRDGGITGQIFGSVNFREGERVETSVITQGEIENNSVVTTESGSRYFLSEKTFQDLKNENKVMAQKELATAPPRATIRLTQFARERDAKAAQESLEKAQPRATFSLSNLFGLGNDSDKEDETAPTTGRPTLSALKPKPAEKSPVQKKAPRGVPSITKWRQNRDKSITGLITGSSAFPENERVTTSPIARGDIASGEVVTTASGSRYFLL